MRRAIPLLVYLAGSMALVGVLQNYFPKYRGMLAYLFLYLMVDLYLWHSVKRNVATFRPSYRNIITGLYWFPPALLTMIVITGFFFSFIHWNIAWRTWIVSVFFISFFSKTLPVISLIAADLWRGITGLIGWLQGIRPVFPVRRNRYLLVTGWILGGMLLLMLAAGMIFWVYDFRVHEQEIRIKNLPPAFDNYRVVHVSDLHLGSWTSMYALAEAVEIINDLDPDVLFVTGDMFNYSSYDGLGYQGVLAGLKARDGIFAVKGNHDYGDYVRWSATHTQERELIHVGQFYDDLGWKLLLNESEFLVRDGDTLVVAGVENWGYERRFQKRADLTKALAGRGNITTTLLLSHDPSYWDRIVSNYYPEVDVTFSGHTHGGQIGWEGKWVRFSMLPGSKKKRGGLYSIRRAGSEPQYLYVNRGLGTVAYAGRIGILPEISLIILRTDH